MFSSFWAVTSEAKAGKGLCHRLGLLGNNFFSQLWSGCLKDSKRWSNHTAGKRNQTIMDRIPLWNWTFDKRRVKVNFWTYNCISPFSLWYLISISPAALRGFLPITLHLCQQSDTIFTLLQPWHFVPGESYGKQKTQNNGTEPPEQGNSLLNLTVERVSSAFQFYRGKNPD